MSKQKIKVLVSKYVSDDYIKLLETGFDVTVITYEDAVNTHPKTLGKIDVQIFSGGADVNPDYYTEKLGKHTGIDKTRDKYEYEMFHFGRQNGALSLGICRGSQFVTVMSGGRLIQHVEGHLGSHEVIIPMLGTNIEVTSTHHQMMYPYDLKEGQYELIAWSKYFKSPTYLNGRNEEIDIDSNFLEPEIVYYHNSNSLAIQGHPEFAAASPAFKEASITLVKYYLERKNRNRNYN